MTQIRTELSPRAAEVLAALASLVALPFPCADEMEIAAENRVRATASETLPTSDLEQLLMLSDEIQQRLVPILKQRPDVR